MSACHTERVHKLALHFFHAGEYPTADGWPRKLLLVTRNCDV